MSTEHYEELIRRAMNEKNEEVRAELFVQIGAIILSSLRRIADALEAGAARSSLLNVGASTDTRQ